MHFTTQRRQTRLMDWVPHIRWETILSWIGLAVGVLVMVANFLFGQHLGLYGVLVAFVAFDYTTGTLAAHKLGVLSSDIGWQGFKKKILILMVPILMSLLDSVTGPAFRIATWGVLYILIANEGVSINENLNVFGIDLPHFVKRQFEGMRDMVDQRTSSIGPQTDENRPPGPDTSEHDG